MLSNLELAEFFRACVKKHFKFFVLYFLFSQNLFSQVQLYLQQPPPNQFKLEHMWRVTLNNPTKNTYRIYLYGKATESRAGFIVDAHTAVFNLPPGVKKVTAADISPIKLDNTNKKYESIVKNTGNVPSGDYEICVSAITNDSQTVLGSDCIEQQVFNFTQIELISPFDASVTGEMFPVFNWLPPSPIQAGQTVSYKLKISEIHLNQSGYDAVQSNPEFFDKQDLYSSVFQYPPSSRNFQPGRRYAWKVYAYINGVQISESEVWEFEYEDPHDWVITIGSGVVSNEKTPDEPPQTGGDGSVQVKTPILIFSGSSKIEGLNSNRQGTDQGIPQRYANWEIVPELSIYKIPFSWNIFLSTQGSDLKQNINSLSLLLNPQKLKEKIEQRAEEELKNQKDKIEQKIMNEVNEKKKEMLKLKYEEQARREGRRKVSRGLKFFSDFKTLGIGVTYPGYSPYTLNAVPVTGVNIEYNPGLFYFAVSGLKNQRAIDNVSYRRNLYSGRIGLGTKEKSHFFLTALYAKDDENSITVKDTNSTLTPKANYLFGTEGKLSLLDDRLSIEGEAVAAMLTRDVRSADISNSSIPDFVKNIIHPKISSSADFTYSFKSSFNNDKTGTKVSAGFKMIGPGFTSLGVPNLATDKLGFDAKIDQKFLDRKVSVSAFFKRDKDNLADWKSSTTTVTAFGINLGLNFKKYPFVRISYSPYFQKNDAPDTQKVDNRTTLLSALAGYSSNIKDAFLTSSVSYSLQQSKTFTGASDYMTHSLYVNEALTFKIPLTLSANLGLIFSKLVAEHSRIVSFDFSGSYQVIKFIQSTAGLYITVEKSKNNKKGLYISASLNPIKYLVLDIRAEQNVYNDWLTNSNNYKEFIFRSTLTATW